MRFLFDGYLLDTDRRELRRGAALLSVEPQVFDVLEFLVRNRDRVVSKDDLLASAGAGGSSRNRHLRAVSTPPGESSATPASSSG